MHNHIKSLLFLICIACTFAPAILSAEISYYNVSLERAIELAKLQDKYIFIDNYADWCKPCKQMDITLSDPELSSYIDRHFISLKVNMETEEGKRIKKRYGVTFLPTLLMLDQDGSLKHRIDKLMTAQDLLNQAKMIVAQQPAIATKNGLNNAPFMRQVEGNPNTKKEEEQKLITEKNAPVVYTYDERASSGRIHIMYHEAYLHAQLADDKQYDVARKYLSTQEDWGTEKNLRFIFDFLHTTDSKEFDYFVENQDKFESIIGKEQVRITTLVLVNKRLKDNTNKLDYGEALRLYRLIDPSTAQQKAQAYVNARS